MKLEDINKERYNKHVKISFFAVCIFMITVSLAISTVLIQLWGGPQGENMWLNMAGVVIAALILAQIYKRLKSHPFLYEVVYVRTLKAELNRIYRKQRKIKAAADEGDATAIAILDFNYRAARHVYELDNNTITLDDLEKAHQEIKNLQVRWNIDQLEAYQPEWVDAY
jgi:predicted alpha/beta-fold hydrolase